MRYIITGSTECCIESEYGSVDDIRAFSSDLPLPELLTMAKDVANHNGKNRYRNRKTFFGVELTLFDAYDTVFQMDQIMTLDDWFTSVESKPT